MFDFFAPDADVPSQRRRLALRPMIALLVLLGGGLAAVSYVMIEHGRAAAPAASAVTAVPVTVGPAAAKDLPIWFTGVGSVQPLNVVNVKVRVDGQLDHVAFVEGQDVHAGDLLAEIDPRPFVAQLKQAEANRAKDQAQLANARLDLTRFSKLASMGASPSQGVDTLKAQVAALEATVQADEAMVDTAGLQLGFTRITSPLDGRVGLRQIDPGSIVHATDATGIVTVTQIQPIAVLFTLTQDTLPEIFAASSQGKLTVDAYTRDDSKSLARGELVFVDSQIDPANGQVRLKAIFPNPDRTLWPGEFVTARLLVRISKDATVVPSRAVLRGQNGTYVYVLKPDDTVDVRAVKTGFTVDGVTALVSGVALGETVVFDGQSRLTPGSKVTVTPPSPTAAGSAS